MKTCTLCQTYKPLTEFNKKSVSKDGLQNVCRECNRARSRKYYESNHDKHRKAVSEQNKRYKARNRDYIVGYLKDHPCIDCGITDVRVLEFDHLPGTDKVNGVARLAAYSAPLESIIREIAKCEVRCRNCHTIKTYERMGGSWHDNYLAPLV